MSQADQPPITAPSRRRLLLAASGPAFIGRAGAAFAALGPADTPLLARGREFEAAWAAERDVHTDIAQAFEVKAAHLKTSRIVRAIGEMAATRLDELFVKARAVAWSVGGAEELRVPGGWLEREQAPTDVLLLEGIARDLLALGGRA